MQYIKCDVSTICIGMAASMGAFLLSSGTKGKRLALPNAEMMIHQPPGGAQGQVTDIEIHAQRIADVKRRHHAARAVDVERNVLVGVLRLQIEKLGDDQAGGRVVDLLRQEDDAVVQKAGENVIGTLSAARLLDDEGTKLIIMLLSACIPAGVTGGSADRLPQQESETF